MAKGAKSQGKSRVKYPRQGGTMGALRNKVWYALRHAEAILSQPDCPDLVRIKAIHAVVTAAGVYHRVLEGTEIEARIRRLEAAVLSRRNGHVRAE